MNASATPLSLLSPFLVCIITSTMNLNGTVTFTNCCCCCCGANVTAANGCVDGLTDGTLVLGWSVNTIGEALGWNDGSTDDSIDG